MLYYNFIIRRTIYSAETQQFILSYTFWLIHSHHHADYKNKKEIFTVAWD